MTRALVVATTLLAAAGCKAPSYTNGGLLCSAAGRCPSGYHCAFDGTCWKNGEDPVAGGDDLAIGGDLGGGDLGAGDLAGGDLAGGVVVDMSPACGWSVAPTNFDPCALGSATSDWISINGTYDTDSASGAGAPIGLIVSQPGGGMARLVYVGMFSVPPGITLTVDGSMPLIIVADTVNVDGTILVNAGRGDPDCSVVVNGSQSASCGAGGAGGAFGAMAGSGGACQGSGNPTGGAAVGSASLAPLRGGCTGGHSGAPGGTTAGGSGLGGGALQISARLNLHVTGTISAPGLGGGAGTANSNGCAGAGCAAGGGGGGSGGAIFLESVSVAVAASGRLCANGGGGGGGAANGAASGSTGGDGLCTEMAATAGVGSGGGGGGANGGYSMHPTGYTAASISTDDGGGGGGGSVGRIRVRASNATPIAVGAVVTPAPFTM